MSRAREIADAARQLAKENRCGDEVDYAIAVAFDRFATLIERAPSGEPQ